MSASRGRTRTEESLQQRGRVNLPQALAADVDSHATAAPEQGRRKQPLCDGQACRQVSDDGGEWVREESAFAFQESHGGAGKRRTCTLQRVGRQGLQ